MMTKWLTKVIRLWIGFVADTHDNLPMVDKAVKEFNQEKVQLVLHAGDYVAPFVIPKFKNLKGRLIGVFGNNDGDRQLLKKKMDEHDNMELRGSFAEISIEGLRIALLHGDQEELLKALITSRSFDIVVHGHTHKAEVSRNGKTLVVNPGEACGYLSGKSTIALFETSRQEVKRVEL